MTDYIFSVVCGYNTVSIVYTNVYIVLEIRVLHTVYQNQGCTSGSGLLHIYIYIYQGCTSGSGLLHINTHQDQGCYILIHIRIRVATY